MTSIATISAQSTFANVQSAINYVRALVGNDFILREGQFAWANLYCAALQKKVESLLPKDHPLYSDVLGGNPSRLFRILDACGELATTKFEAARRDLRRHVITPYLGAHPSDPGALWLSVLDERTPKKDEMKNAHDGATGEFAKGHNFAAGSPERKALCRDSLHGFQACFDMYVYAARACATLAGTMVSYLYNNGWRNNQRNREEGPTGPLDYFRYRDGHDPDDHFDSGADSRGYGQIIGFSNRLQMNVDTARVALNRGYLLTAHVISGVRKDHGRLEEEHSLAIIGQESNGQRVVLGFWDPDAATSTGEFPEKGFGLLYYSDAEECAHATYLAQHKNGRLTTARDEADLLVDTNGYHLQTPAEYKLKRSRHRYQAISMAYG